MRPAALAFCLTFFFTGAAAQPATPPAAPMAASGSFFALSVADLDASAAWYEHALGLHVVTRTPPANGAAALVLEGSGLIVELIRQERGMPLTAVAPAATDRMLVHGMVKAGMIVDDFDAALARLRERRVPIAFGPYPARAGQRANLILRDNAGNLIQLFGPRQ